MATATTMPRLDDLADMIASKLPAIHEHRRPEKEDFEGKTITRFEPDADNVWRFWFTDGTAFAVQSESNDGIGYMELCDVCVGSEDAD